MWASEPTQTPKPTPYTAAVLYSTVISVALRVFETGTYCGCCRTGKG
ncbi:MAG: hypothetical protein ABI335_23160 [Polyangiaceae bacterium]